MCQRPFFLLNSICSLNLRELTSKLSRSETGGFCLTQFLRDLRSISAAANLEKSDCFGPFFSVGWTVDLGAVSNLKKLLL